MRPTVAAVLALLFLNAMLSFRNWWPTPAVVPDARLAPEFVWLWVLLLGVLARRGVLTRGASSLLAGAYLLLVVLRYVDVTVPALFGRALNLYWDLPQIPRFLWVSLQERPLWQNLLALPVLGLPLWGLYRLLRAAIETLARHAVPYALGARWPRVLTALAVVLAVANYAGVRATWPLVSKPVVPTWLHQIDLLLAARSPERMARLLPRAPVVEGALASANPDALAALRGRDLYLVFLESVGAVVYDHPVAAARLAPARARFAQDIAAAGLGVVSAFVRSPTIGGGSDLAHLSLLSGIDLADPRRHDLLLTSDRPTLVSVFRSHGYRSFGFYPAVSWEWPERAYYGYEVYVEGRDLDYRGPALGNWKIPDQVAFARFEQMYPRGPSAPPRFVFAATINTHLPFSPVPPYQPDWARVLGDAPFDAADTARAQAERPDWLDMLPAYLRSVEYGYRWLGGFLRQPQPREAVYVLLGDHQPTANVTGEGASWDVPVHVLSRDPQLLARFTGLGFAEGLDPPRTPLGGMHELTGLLLQAFAARR